MASSFTPKALNFGTGAATDFSGATSSNNPVFAIACAQLPPATWRYTTGGSTTNYTYGSGLLAVLTAKAAGYYIDLFDLSTTARANSNIEPALTSPVNPAVGDDSTYPYCGITPLQRGRAGCIAWVSNGPSVALNGELIKLVINGYYSQLWQTLNMTIADDISVNTALVTSRLICDVQMIPRAQNIQFFVCNGDKTAGNAQLHLCRITPNMVGYTSIASSESCVVEWSKEFVAASYTPWTGRPDTCLTCQAFPTPNLPYAVALLGNDALAGTIAHVRVTSPRLAIIDLNGNIIGGADGGRGSHINAGAGVAAHGMCLTEDGYIFVCGTGSLVGASGNPLIERFHYTDLSDDNTDLYKQVAFDANDLGGNFGSAGDTHVVYPHWDGQHLIVYDEGTTNTREFVFTKDLATLIRVTTRSSSAATGYTRFRGGNKGISWWANRY